MFFRLIFANKITQQRVNKKSKDRIIPIKHKTFVVFEGDNFQIKEIPSNLTLGFSAITNLTLFNVTHTSIITFDFSN